MDHVGDQDVGVQMRVAGPGGAVPEGGGHEPVGHHLVEAAVTPPGPGRLDLEDAQGLGHGCLVGVPDRSGHLGRSQGEEQGHRLGGGEGGVEAGDLGRPLGSAEPLPRSGMASLQDGVQVVGLDLAGQAEQVGAVAGPLAGGFAGTGVVVLDAGGDGVEVVLLHARRQLAEAQHRPTWPGRGVPARQGTSGASASVRLGTLGTRGIGMVDQLWPKRDGWSVGRVVRRGLRRRGTGGFGGVGGVGSRLAAAGREPLARWSRSPG